ncbi:MAG: InlB B-repeat-containing protein [Bacteroidales bacterium]|nr:InlB B-repeat-containing protein [Bacteroidales bacterium]
MSEFVGMRIPEGNVVMIESNGIVLWNSTFGYVSLGDSIPAGHTIDENWITDYGEGSQYGVNGNTSTAIVPDSYTDRIGKALDELKGEVSSTSFARSGDTVADLIEKLSHDVVKKAIRNARLVTICIGANDVLQPALSQLDEYINYGDLSTLESIVEGNLAKLNNDSYANSYWSLFNKLVEINPNARYVFTTIYNPYKYLWIEEGTGGFFKPLLDMIPEMNILGYEIDEYIKSRLGEMSMVKLLFSRVNGLDDWAERYVTQLNTIIKNKVSAYGGKFSVADTKALFDSFPDRPVSGAEKHYNDLVSVEYTRGYNTATMDWGRLHGGDVTGYWTNLINKYGLDLEGLSTELVTDVVEKVIVPDVDPHPEPYGHYVMMRSFADVLEWASLDRYKVTFDMNGGTGAMGSVDVVGVDGMPAYVYVNSAYGTHPSGYDFVGWNTKADGTGTTYSNGQLMSVTGDVTLYAKWDVTYTINYYKIYGITDALTKRTYPPASNSGPVAKDGSEYYLRVTVDGVVLPGLNDNFNVNDSTSQVRSLMKVRKGAELYIQLINKYTGQLCELWMNGTQIVSGSEYIRYTLPGGVQSNMNLMFEWRTQGSLLTGNAQSYWVGGIQTW